MPTKQRDTGADFFVIALALGTAFAIGSAIVSQGGSAPPSKESLIGEIEDLKLNLNQHGWIFDASWDREKLVTQSIPTLTGRRDDLRRRRRRRHRPGRDQLHPRRQRQRLHVHVRR